MQKQETASQSFDPATVEALKPRAAAWFEQAPPAGGTDTGVDVEIRCLGDRQEGAKRDGNETTQRHGNGSRWIRIG